MTTKEMVSAEKGDWVLAALLCAPLDRMRLMEALFLFWHESGRDIPGFFEFEPYTHGPCSFEFYSELDRLEAKHLISRAPHPAPQRARYHLTKRGQIKAEQVRRVLGQEKYGLLQDQVTYAAEASLLGLLKRVYEQAPDFLGRAIVRV